MIFKSAHFVELRIDLQSFNVVGCLGRVLQRDLKNTMTTSLFWDSKFPYFVKLIIGYQPAKFETSRLSGSNFTEVGIRHQKHNYDVIMTSFHMHK